MLLSNENGTNEHEKAKESTVSKMLSPFVRLLNNIAKLIDVKSLMTLSLTACFIYLMITDNGIPEQLNNVYLIIVGFYFGTQVAKVTDKEVR